MRSLSAVVIFLGLAGAQAALAGPYSPDPAFGGHGFVFGPGRDWEDVIAMPDGRVLVVGDAGPSQGIAVARFQADGALDTTFGGDGMVESPFPSPISSGAVAVALQGDGKIVVAGWTTFLFDANIVVLRYLADGTLDAGFGTGGIVQTDPDDYLFPSDLVIQPDGKIVVVGGAGLGGDIVVLRYLADGTPDASFGGDGSVAVELTNASEARGVAPQPDGRIVVVGSRFVPHTGNRLAVLRLLADGSLDPAFGVGGVVPNDDTPSHATAVALLPDGRIYVGGGTTVSNAASWLVIRYLADGSLDGAYGAGGTVTTPMPGNGSLADLALQPDGRLVAAGDAYDNLGYWPVMVRYLPDGLLDPSLGTVITLPGTDRDVKQAFHAVAIAADGDIVAAGSSYDSPDGFESLVVRYGTDFPVCWDGVVDAPEQCDDRNYVDGDCCSSTCQPANEGTACTADIDPCTTDVCQGGSCLGVAEPQTSCKGPTPPSRGLFFVNASREKLTWNWLRGEATASFLEQGYKLCVYDDSAGPQPVTQLTTNCGLACWTQQGSHLIYVDHSETYDGISRIRFRAGPDGEARIQFRARGANLPVTPLPLVTPVAVQLHGLGDGQCWTASYGAPGQSDSGKFKAKPD
jgi:uncharacterized delta-60 repeat protein